MTNCVASPPQRRSSRRVNVQQHNVGLFCGNKSSALWAPPHSPARGKAGEGLIWPARIEAAAIVGEGGHESVRDDLE